MKFRSRNAILGAAVLAPLMALTVWFASAPANRCTLYQNLGFVYLAKGTLASHTQLKVAEQLFTSPAATACRSDSATFGLAQAYSQDGQFAPAISALGQGSDRAGLRHFETGRLYEQMGRYENAWFEYSRLPIEAAAYFFQLGNGAEKRGDYQQALHEYRIATMINPKNAKYYYSSAFIYWRHFQDDNTAVALIKQALEVDKKPSVDRDFYQGLLCYYQDRNGCAVAAWVSATRETATINRESNPRYLAYEMLSRVLYEETRPTSWRLALSGDGVGAR